MVKANDVYLPALQYDGTLMIAYYPKMRGKRSGLITVCGDPDVHTADPIVHSFKSTAEMTKLTWLGSVMASAADKGEIVKNETAIREAYELGRKAATP